VRWRRAIVPLLRFGLAATLLFAGACRSVPDPAYETDDGRELESIPKRPFRIGVAPVTERETRVLVQEQSDPLAEDENHTLGSASERPTFEFRMSAAEMQERLVHHLGKFSAGHEVFPIDESSPDDAYGLHPDLIVRPVLQKAPEFVFLGTSDNSKRSFWLWFWAWRPGLDVPDRSYQARATFDISLVNPHDRTPLANFPAASEKVDLSFLDRHEGEDGRIAAAIVVPPAWTPESRSATSDVLADKLMERTAAIISGYLHDEFARDEVALTGGCTLLSPHDGSVLETPEVELHARIQALEPVSDVAVYRLVESDGGLEPAKIEPAEEVPPLEQRRGSLYVLPFKVPLELAEARNMVRIEWRVGGRMTSRTYVLWHCTEEQLKDKDHPYRAERK
jgi:hypothetical protein